MNIKRVNCSVNDFNKQIDFFKNKKLFIEENPEDEEYVDYDLYAYVWESDINVCLITKGYHYLGDNYKEYKKEFYNPKIITQYCARLDNRTDFATYTPSFCFGVMQKYFKTESINVITDEIPIVSSFLWYNDSWNGGKVHAYGYDLNSAYSSVMCGLIPDCSNGYKRTMGIVQEGEVGFDLNLDLIKKGKLAYYIFNLIESPYKKFINVWYTKKKTAPKGSIDRANAKFMLNSVIGYLKYKNPFLRAYIINKTNNLIKSLIDENTIYCNTDSIVSLKPRPDLKIGINMGEWKIEHEGDFSFINSNYQWSNDKYDNNEIVFRGIPKSRFDEDFNLISDELPTKENDEYYFDSNTLQIQKKGV